MKQLQINKGRHAVRARRRLEREAILPLDPHDPELTRAKELQAAARRGSDRRRRETRP
jgi:hypothetical protein